MSRFGRVVVGVVVGTMLFAGSASAATPTKKKKVSTAKYAKIVCANYTDMSDLINAFVDTYNTGTSDDPVTFHGEAIDLTNDLIADLETLQKKLNKAYPDIDDGKAIGKGFAATVADRIGAISDGLAEFEAADPTGVAFQADVTSFELVINLIDVGETDPFAAVTDQDLLGAFNDEKSCKDVVTIF